MAGSAAEVGGVVSFSVTGTGLYCSVPPSLWESVSRRLDLTSSLPPLTGGSSPLSVALVASVAEPFLLVHKYVWI